MCFGETSNSLYAVASPQDPSWAYALSCLGCLHHTPACPHHTDAPKSKEGEMHQGEYGKDSQQTGAVPRSNISRPSLAAGQLPSGRHWSLLSGQPAGQGPRARGLALEGPRQPTSLTSMPSLPPNSKSFWEKPQPPTRPVGCISLVMLGP